MVKKTKAPKTNGGISRREFARRAALTAAGLAVLPADSLVHVAPAAIRAIEAPQTREKKLSAESQAEVNAKIEAIFQKYGARLSEAQKADIRRILTEGQASLVELRAFPVENSDQPATVLKLYPESATGRRRARGGASAAKGKV